MAQLRVTVIEGKNLKKQDLFSDNDAYVEVYLDNKKRKQKTSVKYDSKFPKWNESFTFDHSKGQDTLHVMVYDKDFIFDDKIGSVKVNLQELYVKGHIDHWYDLPSKFGGSSHGQIHLLLDYQPLRF